MSMLKDITIPEETTIFIIIPILILILIISLNNHLKFSRSERKKKKENNILLKKHPEYNEDITELIKFIKKMHTLIEIFIEYHPILMPEDEKTLKNYKKAWEKVQPRFRIAEKYLEHEKPILDLIEAGLVDSELILKIQVCTDKMENVIVLRKEHQKMGDNEQKNEKLNHLGYSLEEAMDHGDIILGSLAEAGIPGVGAIGEIKTIGEKIMKWWRNKKKRFGS